MFSRSSSSFPEPEPLSLPEIIKKATDFNKKNRHTCRLVQWKMTATPYQTQMCGVRGGDGEKKEERKKEKEEEAPSRSRDPLSSDAKSSEKSSESDMAVATTT